MIRATASQLTVSRPSAASGSVTLRADSGTVGYARTWVAWQLDVLLSWVPVSLLDDVQLVVSEFVTNALRAESTAVGLTLSQSENTVVLTVHDDAAGVPTVQHPDSTETHGRGLLIVAAIVDAWGVDAVENGKQIWARFTVPAAGAIPQDDSETVPGRTVAAPEIPLDAVLGDPSTRTVTDALIGELLDDVRRSMLVDTAAILLIDQSRQFLVATAARGIEEEVRQGARVRLGVGFAGRIANEKRPIVLPEITPRNVSNPLLLRHGIVSMLGVPIFEGDRVLGVMHVGTLNSHHFTPLDVAMLQRAAGRAAQVLIRHRAFVDRAGAAALLHSLTPRLPEIPGLDLAARYVPGSAHGVGGDWYDVFRLPSGAIGVAIGDVMGHGLHAATVMGRMRSALRSYALDDERPAQVLFKLDRKIRHFEPGHLATAIFALLDPASGHVSIASAGHLPPIVVYAPGVAKQIDIPTSPPIGVPPGYEHHQIELTLTPGAVLCLYTDGLVERRTRDISDEMERLRQALAVAPLPTADAACVEAMAEMLGDREPEDDISLLSIMLRSLETPA